MGVCILTRIIVPDNIHIVYEPENKLLKKYQLADASVNRHAPKQVRMHTIFSGKSNFQLVRAPNRGGAGKTGQN